MSCQEMVRLVKLRVETAKHQPATNEAIAGTFLDMLLFL